MPVSLLSRWEVLISPSSPWHLRSARFLAPLLVAASALAALTLATPPAAAHIHGGVGFGYSPCCGVYDSGPSSDEPPPGSGEPPPQGNGEPPPQGQGAQPSGAPPVQGGQTVQPSDAPPPTGQAGQTVQPSGAPASTGQTGQTVQPSNAPASTGQTVQPANCKQGQWRQANGSMVNGTACQQADGSWKLGQ
jgi:hypothetical protein